MTIIYFNDESKNIYSDIRFDKDTAKRLSRRIYRNAMTALAADRQAQARLLQSLYIDNGIST